MNEDRAAAFREVMAAMDAKAKEYSRKGDRAKSEAEAGDAWLRSLWWMHAHNLVEAMLKREERE